MPFSESSLLSPVMNMVERIRPQSVLDVGIGFGQYGVLCRNNLEHLNLFEWNDHMARKRERSEWLVRIDGIEAFPDYVTPVQEYVYNEIYKGDALEILPGLDFQYEMILAIEILEHFDKDDGLRFLKLLDDKCSGSIIVTTPKEFIPQDYPANPYENHRSLWTREELESCGFSEFHEDPTSWIARKGPD